jgi:DNA-binding CsgD family transcriptional regulator
VTFVISWVPVNGLRQADLLAVLEFLDEASGLVGGDDVFPRPVLARLERLVPCDLVTYCELDYLRKRGLRSSDSHEVVPPPDGEERFWRFVDEHPLCAHLKTGDFGAHKLSDFLTLRQLRLTEVYAEYFRPWGIEYELEVGIPSPRSHTKTFLFDRSRGPDFTERDRDLLNLLQPHLCRLYAIAELRRGREGQQAVHGDLPLTPREREILEQVRLGRTNAEVASLLWISPLTVRRHLENVYEKLGVHTRTAAAAWLSNN